MPNASLMPLILALIREKLSVRMCYVRRCYVVIFAAHVPMVPLKCFKKAAQTKLKLRPENCRGLL